MFDLDGTLIDTPRVIIELFRQTFNQLRINYINDDDIRSTIGIPLADAFTKLTKETNKCFIDSCISIYQEHYKEILLPMSKQLIYPGVEETLLFLDKNNIEMAIVTNKFYNSAYSLLERAGLLNFFKEIIGSDLVKYPKPNPEGVEKVMKSMNIDRVNSIMVGDTTHDILMAENANIKSIAVTYGVHSIDVLTKANATWVVNDFRTIQSILENNYILENVK